jgi:peptidoglycan/LPS O-acetylase OafA/YrhL
MIGAFRAWWMANIVRPNPAQQFLPAIDGLRFVAIALVVLYHLQGYVSSRAGLSVHGGDGLHRWLVHGSYGVPLFFSISGFIIASQWFGGRPPSLKAYFLRRITRLEPPYIVSMLAIFALKILFLGATFPDLLPHLLASLVYLHGPIYGTHSEVNGVAWSLEVEWQFYLLAPLILGMALRVSPRLAAAGLLALTLLGGVVYWQEATLPARIALSVLNFGAFFVAGVLVALLHSQTPIASRPGYDALSMLAAIAIGAALAQHGAWAASLPLLTGLFLWSSLRSRWWSSCLSWWPIHGIGAMCYTIYLYHFFVISALGKLLPASLYGPTSGHLLAVALIVVPLVVVCCAIPYLLVERPFMVWRPGSTALRDALPFRR